jgi:hypothetical protein
MNKNSRRGRKSNILMKFSMVSDILMGRMREQLCIEREAKQMILDSLAKLKESFLIWGTNSHSV